MMRVAIVQLRVAQSKRENIAAAVEKIAIAAKHGAELVVLPECFNSPYGTEFFQKYSESVPNGETCTALGQAARQGRLWLVGGTIPERDGGRLYNTCPVFSPDGGLVATYRKMHLFDIDIPGKITFKESETLTAGSAFCTFGVGGRFKVGLGICYDLRFCELASILAAKGCNLLIYPGAFNTTTGPLHWELLQRGRAVDNACYVVTASPARDPAAAYKAFGHSLVVDPMGRVVLDAGEGEALVYADLDAEAVAEMRRSIPTLAQKRTDVYVPATAIN